MVRVAARARARRRSASGAWAASTAEADPDVRAEAAAAVIAAAEGVGAQAFGLVETGAETISVVNSLGIRVSEARSRGQVLTVMMGPGGGTGYAEQVAVDIAAIDASAIGREAAERTAAMKDPIELARGRLPGGARQLCRHGRGAVARPRRLRCPGRAGAAVVLRAAARSWPRRWSNLADDGTDPAGAPASFDYEGVAKQRVPLLERGRLSRDRPRHQDRRPGRGDARPATPCRHRTRGARTR